MKNNCRWFIETFNLLKFVSFVSFCCVLFVKSISFWLSFLEGEYKSTQGGGVSL